MVERSRKTHVVKIGSDSPTAKRSATDVIVTSLGYVHYKRLVRVIEGMARIRTLAAQWPLVLCRGQNCLNVFPVNNQITNKVSIFKRNCSYDKQIQVCYYPK